MYLTCQEMTETWYEIWVRLSDELWTGASQLIYFRCPMIDNLSTGK